MNYLNRPALTQVQNLDKIEEIWKRLEAIFSDVQLLLQKGLSSIDKIGGLRKVKDDEKLMNVIPNLLNGMAELKALATRHGLDKIIVIRFQVLNNQGFVQLNCKRLI